jgi:hypothetical protein
MLQSPKDQFRWQIRDEAIANSSQQSITPVKTGAFSNGTPVGSGRLFEEVG